jgi:pimeloyl-ACP methyl ester carboxylesterase
MNRRELFRLAGAAGLVAAAPSLGLAAPAPRRTFVLVHGAWHGGWCWDHVADRLRGLGHRVFTPTCTGLGERAHLISKDITLDTFGTDVGNVIEAEELDQVVLVAHSFAGSVASILAERMPRRLKQLVYLDALIVEPGKSPFDSIPAELVASRRKQAAETSGGVSLPNPPPSAFGVPDGPGADWVRRRMTPHPISTYESKLNIRGPVGNNLPRTYIHCTRPSYEALEASRTWVKAQSGWNWLDLPTGHDAMVVDPEGLTRMLVSISA